MTEKEIPNSKELKLDENPYDPSRKRPEDVVRLFYQHDVPIIPVVSKRGVLIGILKKEDVISELSDIDRVEKLPIDTFITKLATRMSLDVLLNFGKVREFIVINIFGEIHGRWSRLELFAAAETGEKEHKTKVEVETQREDQTLEWMIYLILEHIPRPLYALNIKNKTIFYNSHFEELYKKKFKKEVESAFVEKSLKDPHKNHLISSEKEGEHNFFNDDLAVYYEKIPLMGKQKRAGYLIFCLKETDRGKHSALASISIKGKTLTQILDSVERQAIVDTLHRVKGHKEAARELKMSIKQLDTKIKKHSIIEK